MVIDSVLLNNLISLYEDELDERKIERKLKDMSASNIIDLKNAFDNKDFSKVDKLMGVSIEEGKGFKDIDQIATLAGLPMHETASAGGTSAGTVASGPAVAWPFKKKKKKKGKKKKGKKKSKSNPYGYDGNLVRRWK